MQSEMRFIEASLLLSFLIRSTRVSDDVGNYIIFSMVAVTVAVGSPACGIRHGSPSAPPSKLSSCAFDASENVETSREAKKAERA